MNLQKNPSLNFFPGKRKKATKQGAFTLVELIVVITILVILSTIGFVSYSSYLAGSRDTNRISQLKAISEGLDLYSANHRLPTPDDSVNILSNGLIIAYQGYAGKEVLKTIIYSTQGVDPKDKTYFSYYVTKNKKDLQLMAFLEEEDNLQINLNAIEYTKRYTTVYGSKLGILTNTGSVPIQELGITELDIALTLDEYVAHFSDSSNLSGTGINLKYIENVNKAGGIASSCKILLDRNKGLKGRDGIYMIDPEVGNPIPMYCDMTNDGGGWGLVSEYDFGLYDDSWADDKINFESLWTDIAVGSIVNECVGTEGFFTYSDDAAIRGTYFKLDIEKYNSKELKFYHKDNAVSFDKSLGTTLYYTDGSDSGDNFYFYMTSGEGNVSFDQEEKHIGGTKTIKEFSWEIDLNQLACGDKHEIGEFKLWIR